MDPMELTSEELPPELQELKDEMLANRTGKIEAIGKEVAAKRDEAVKGRKQSGIETIWQEDEEFYEGIDDANREQHAYIKSASTTGGIARNPSKATTRCTAFFNITRQFVESASARMGDILLPAGDWNFTIKPTPKQDVDNEQTAEFADTPEMQKQAEQKQAAADAKAEKAETQIRDWLVECSYHTEVRKVIEDAAKLGTGILKGCYPKKSTAKKVSLVDGKMALEIIKKTVPASKRVDPWDFFPDPACCDDIHDGDYVFERDRLTARQLKDLKGVQGYLDEQIDKVLDEGAGGKNYSDGQRVTENTTGTDDKFEVWYYYGLVDVVGLSAMSVKLSEKESGKKMLPAIVTLVNDTPIKAFINPLDSGDFPYDVMPWQPQSGTWTGIGVSRQGRTPQEMLNSSARQLMDNAGLSGAPMIIMRQNAIIPQNGKWELAPRKIWLATEQADVRSVADAILAINVPMMQAELTAIIELAYKMMEDATGIAYLLQGQQGSAPDTVGGMELLHRNASAILRRLARVYDERVTEPHVRRYYEWLLIHGDEDCKGDFKIEAIGSTALVEREIQAMESQQLLQMSLDPRYGLDPEKAILEVLKAKRYIPEKWTMDEAKKKEQAKQQPTIPAIEVAKIRAQTDEKRLAHDNWKAKLLVTADMKESEADTDRDLLYVQSIARRDEMTSQIRLQELQDRKELAILDYANRRNITLDQVKAGLAKEAMKLKVQKELSGVAGEMDAPQIATPPTEPAQHAPDGRAFQE